MECLKDIENHEISDYFLKRICENFNFRICIVEKTVIVNKFECKLPYFIIFHNNKRVFASDGTINIGISWCVEKTEEMKYQFTNFKNHIIYLINEGFDVLGTDDGNLRIAFPHGSSESEIMMKMEIMGLIR